MGSLKTFSFSLPAYRMLAGGLSLIIVISSPAFPPIFAAVYLLLARNNADRPLSRVLDSTLEINYSMSVGNYNSYMVNDSFKQVQILLSILKRPFLTASNHCSEHHFTPPYISGTYNLLPAMKPSLADVPPLLSPTNVDQCK